jgi:hypothetical protein
LLGKKPEGKISMLVDQLADRIVNRNDFVLVSWYFLQHWLPIHGPEAAMLILLTRNMCFFNDQTGEIRDEVQIHEGFEEIANRLGIPNQRLVSSWFAGKPYDRAARVLTLSSRREMDRQKALQDVVGQFIQIVDRRQTRSHAVSLRIKVQRVDPLLPEHEQLLTGVNRMLAAIEKHSLQNEFRDWLDRTMDACFETLNNDQMLEMRRSIEIADCSETLKTILHNCFETLKLSDGDCFETLLKILKNILETQKNQDTHPEPDTELASKARVVVAPVISRDGNWSLEKFLKKADGKNRELLLGQEWDAQAYVSWIIYGASQPKIQNPISLAIARLKEHPNTGAGMASDNLAALKPEVFAGILLGALSFNPVIDEDWVMLFGNQPTVRVRLLSDCLGLRLDEIEQQNFVNS